MVKLQTKVPIPPSDFQINHFSKILSIGSCFAENMSVYLKERKFQVVTNPCGILYNPLSIGRGLEMILSRKVFQQKDLFYHNELWQSFDHHGEFSGMIADEVLNKMNNSIENAHTHLQKANTLIITLGTAFTYFKNGQPVANCHKVPAAEFEKRLLSVDEIVEALSSILKKIQTNVPSLHIIFTISPIRHIRDGVVENQQSKATLILAVHQLIHQLSNAYYFPSYEMVLDELRDYRFYKKDLVHLNEVALEYIWEQFSDTFFSEDTKALNRKFEKLRAAFLHRPFHPQSEEHQRFLRKQYQIVSRFQEEFGELDFEEELEYFNYL